MASGVESFTYVCFTGSFLSFLVFCHLISSLCANLIELQLSLQTIDTRIKLASALAKQWFGVYITPESPNDGGLVAFFYTSLCLQFVISASSESM